jgi:Mrp family chromosome partitioning ATPase/capsular polysaccharide biosynthesis protein
MNDNPEATAIFAPIWKRKWMILIVALIAAGGSYFYYNRQPPRYSASTQLYLGNGAEEQASVSGSGGKHSSGGGGKKAGGISPATQAQLINSSIVKSLVRERLRKQHKNAAVHAALKGKAKAKAASKSEFITIAGEARSPLGVALLVDATAQAWIKRENSRYHREVESAIALTRRQIRKIEAETAGHPSKGSSAGKGKASATSTLQVATLSQKINQLEEDLPISQITQVDPATRKSATLVAPHPKSNAIFGFVVGLLLAVFAAYGLGRLDRRLRSLGAIEGIFGAPILTALPAVRRPILHPEGHPLVAKALREALWRLQSTLQVGLTSEQEGASAPRVILCVSADAGDGKSTLVAGLALAQSDAGERVAVIEADFRRPVQSRLLDLSGGQGLADVLDGRLTVEEAMQQVSLIRPEAGVSAGPVAAGATATLAQSSGAISVLVGRTDVTNPPAVLSRPAMTDLPRALAEEYDYVLIDAPAPLQVSDVMPLLALVDGIVIVARAGHTREASARRLVQILKQTPSAPVLGIAANAVSQADKEKFGLSARTGRRWRPKLLGG